MEKKLILPAEVKICATCSYWDGERRVDEELNLVVVDEDCRGECLVQEQHFDGLNDVRQMKHCVWESLGGDEPQGTEGGEAAVPDAKTGT